MSKGRRLVLFWLITPMEYVRLIKCSHFPSQGQDPAAVALPEWDDHPESDMPVAQQDDLVALARVLGRTIQWLMQALAEDTNLGRREERKVADKLERDLELSVPVFPNRRPTLVDLASTYITPDMVERTEAQASDILRELIVQEINRCDENYTLDYEKLWAFAERRTEPTKQYFSLNRWPVEVQTPYRQEQILASGPRLDRSGRREATGSPGYDTSSSDDDDNSQGDRVIDSRTNSPKQRHIRGSGRFPFGETALQELVLSRRMERDLVGGRPPKHSYICYLCTGRLLILIHG